MAKKIKKPLADTVQDTNDLAAAEEESMNPESIPVETSQASSANVVHVRACHPGAISFNVGGKTVTLNGSNMHIPRDRRRPLAVGEYGKTVIDRSDWSALIHKFGHKKMFLNGFINAFEKEADADAWVAGFSGEKAHGLDPVKIEDTATQMKTDD